MCRVTICQTSVHLIISKSHQQRTGVFELQHYLASRELLWTGHVESMLKGRLSKRLLISRVRTPRVAGGQEMALGRSLERHLGYFNPPTAFAEWALRGTARPGTNLSPGLLWPTTSNSYGDQEATSG